MFTGIIAAIGQIGTVTASASGIEAGLRLSIDSGALPLAGVAVGDSIAINGVCLTAVEIGAHGFLADVSAETLARTVGLDAPGAVNLEKALCLGDALGGHLVSGHVDGVGEVVEFEPVGDSHLLRIRAPRELARFFAYKGSATVNGVSLTVNQVEDLEDGCVFSVNLIPHTIAATTLKSLASGSRVNLEVDMIARYTDRLLEAGARAPHHPSSTKPGP